MIVNNDRKFAFVHIQKTAGISVSDVLSRISGTQLHGPRHNFVTELLQPESYYKFTFVRNPWDRLYSWYNMMIHKGCHNSFSKYLLTNSKCFSEFLDCTGVVEEKEEGKHTNTRSKFLRSTSPCLKSISFNQLDYISDVNGNVAVDFIGRFERLSDDFSHVLRAVGASDTNLPLLNKFIHDDYRKHFTTADVDKVSMLYKRDIEYFGYDFEPGVTA